MKKIIRLSSMTALLLATIAGAALFWVSQQVQEIERHQRQVRSEITREEEALRVLSAEWDYLNRPDRLEALSVRYLQLESGGVDTILQNVNAIPEPAEIPIPPRGRPVFVSGGAEKLSAPVAVSTKPDTAPIRDAAPSANPTFEDVLNGLEKKEEGQ
jgi:hypothetical protein